MIFTKYIFYLADYPWVDLQCTEALHGDESEAVRRVHAEIQSGTNEGKGKAEAETGCLEQS